MRVLTLPSKVPINNNPYQGLKRQNIGLGQLSLIVPINNNPYQGLKRIPVCHWCRYIGVPINNNPYQGLKRDANPQAAFSFLCSN